MDKYGKIMSRLNILKETHPNLSTLWIKHINKSMDKFINTIDECENIINQIEEMDDINPLTLLLLYEIKSNNINVIN